MRNSYVRIHKTEIIPFSFRTNRNRNDRTARRSLPVESNVFVKPTQMHGKYTHIRFYGDIVAMAVLFYKPIKIIQLKKNQLLFAKEFHCFKLKKEINLFGSSNQHCITWLSPDFVIQTIAEAFSIPRSINLQSSAISKSNAHKMVRDFTATSAENPHKTERHARFTMQSVWNFHYFASLHRFGPTKFTIICHFPYYLIPLSYSWTVQPWLIEMPVHQIIVKPSFTMIYFQCGIRHRHRRRCHHQNHCMSHVHRKSRYRLKNHRCHCRRRFGHQHDHHRLSPNRQKERKCALSSITMIHRCPSNSHRLLCVQNTVSIRKSEKALTARCSWQPNGTPTRRWPLKTSIAWIDRKIPGWVWVAQLNSTGWRFSSSHFTSIFFFMAFRIFNKPTKQVQMHNFCMEFSDPETDQSWDKSAEEFEPYKHHSTIGFSTIWGQKWFIGFGVGFRVLQLWFG